MVGSLAVCDTALLIGGKVWTKSVAYIFMAGNMFIVENGSSVFKRGTAGLLETLIPTKQHGVAFQITVKYKYINNHVTDMHYRCRYIYVMSVT